MFLRKMKGEMKESDSSTSMMQSFGTDSGVVWERGEKTNKVLSVVVDDHFIRSKRTPHREE